MTNPTPSPEAPAPSQAARECAIELDSNLMLDSIDSKHLLAEGAAIIDKHIAQLAETNGKALADANELLDIARSSIELLRGQVAEAKQALADCHRDLLEYVATRDLLVEQRNADYQAWHGMLAQSQAREASLAAALKEIAKQPLSTDFSGAADLPDDYEAGYDECVKTARAALARHQAAVESVGITDTQRLDWLCKNGRRVTHATGFRGEPDGWVWIDGERTHHDVDLLRDAIDAAMKQRAESSGNKRTGESL